VRVAADEALMVPANSPAGPNLGRASGVRQAIRAFCDKLYRRGSSAFPALTSPRNLGSSRSLGAE
jgi:hypothetical protein